MASPLGSAPGAMIGAAVGAAGALALAPVIEPAKQEAWSNAPNRVLTPALYAALVAQGALDLGVGQGLSKREGFNEDQFNRLVHLALRAPTHSEAQDLRRRGRITAEQLRHTFAKEQIEEQYWDALAELVDDRLSPQNVAVAIVRGLMVDPGFLPVSPPTEVGKVPAFPVSKIDPVTESESSGINSDRLAVLTGIFGRPPGPELTARAYFRGILELADYYRSISEGDVRNEWRDAILEVSREILTSNNYAELELRGFLTADQRAALTDQHGLSRSDSDRLVDLLGRSISVHQVTTGLARGGKYPGSYANVPEPYKSAIQRSNIRQEWSELDYANRFSYPSGFQIKAEATSGAMDEAQVEQLLLEVGWSPRWAKFFAQQWTAQAKGIAVDPWVKKADTQLWTATHKAYKGGAIDETLARTNFDLIGIAAAAQDQIIARWDAEKNL